MNNARIVFVRPPNLQKSGEWKKQGVVRCPLNIAMLASYIRTRGSFDCTIVDFEIIQAHTPSEMAACILEQHPAYVCFTTLTPRFPTVVRICREIRAVRPEVITIVGGPHVTGLPSASLFDGVSYGIIGEGEDALLELLNCLEQKSDPSSVRNLVYTNSAGTTVVNECRPFMPNLDELPFPAWDLMQINEYLDAANYDGPHLAIFTARGCPFDCKFCASSITWRRKYRVRSVDSVMEEIRHIVRVIGIRNIMFFDDTVAVNRKRLLDLCDRLIREKLNISYVVQTRADDIDDELVTILKNSGCTHLHIGVESGNEEMLKKIGKRLTKDQMRKAIEILKRNDMPAIASYILGLPGDTHETIRETIDFAFELDAYQSKFMILGVFPGTEYYEKALKMGLADPQSFEQMEALNYYDSVAINLSNVSDEDLLRYQDEAFERFDRSRGRIP